MSDRAFLAQALRAPWSIEPNRGRGVVGDLLRQMHRIVDEGELGAPAGERFAAQVRDGWPTIGLVRALEDGLVPPGFDIRSASPGLEFLAGVRADDVDSDALVEFWESDDTIEDLQREEAEAVPASIRRKSGAVAVVPVMGPIFNHENWLTRWAGLPSYDGLVRTLRQLVGNDGVKAIVLRFDSPGGMSEGGHEAALELLAMRDQKPIVSMIDPNAHSAAIHLAAMTSEIVITPSGSTASIGTWLLYVNEQGWLEQAGLEVEMIRNPERKAEGNPWEPLTDEARAHLQAEIDHFSDTFRSDVAKGRGVSVATVAEQFGQGATMLARDAKAAGLVDRIATFAQTLERLGAVEQTNVGDEASRSSADLETRRRRARANALAAGD